jgi:branched-chain amino acid transport system permease protein
MTAFLQTLLNGLLSGALYALVAVGLGLVWGVLNVINFAHGEFLMVGMYVSFWLGFLLKVDPVISWIFSGVFVFLLGILSYHLIVRRTMGRAMAPLLATFGLSLCLRNVMLSLFSPNFRILSDTFLEGKKFFLGPVVVPIPQLAVAILSVITITAVYVMLHRTRFGMAVRATALDSEAAELVGIDTKRIFILVFGIGGACVGIAGGLLPSYIAVHPDVGVLYGLIAFMIVAMGGFGSISGVLFAAVIVGLVESFAGFYLAPVLKYVAVFAIYIIVILMRPKGLRGW